MKVFLALPGNERLARWLAVQTGGAFCGLRTRRFPDGETYVRLGRAVLGDEVYAVCTLAHPDRRTLRLLLAAGAARDAGARRVVLVAPYLAYMRQDRVFAEGEAISARHFARLLSHAFEGLVTVDPHLHRIRALGEIFDIPARALHAAPLLADWVRVNVERPLLIGPDVESRQWVEAVADRAAAPFAVLTKVRRADRQVEIELPALATFSGRQPVLIDDIISSGTTMIQAARMLQAAGVGRPVCLAVHGLFAQDAFERLSALAETVVTTDSVPHPSNGISIAHMLADGLSGI